MTTLLLVHAFPLAPTMWRDMTAYLDGADLGISIVAPALAGFAGRPPSSQSPSLELFAHELLAEVEGEVVVGGCSLGGYVAMAMMRLEPDRVAGVVLMDTKCESDEEEARSKRHAVADGVEREGIAAWVDRLAAPLLGPTTVEENPALVSQVRSVIEHADPAGVAWAQRAMAIRPDSRGTLANWSKPALVVVGAEDGLAPVELAMEMSQLLPRGELSVIPGAGHLAPWEKPAEVAEVIAQWWATAFGPGE